jgi:hypothetical protein
VRSPVRLLLLAPLTLLAVGADAEDHLSGTVSEQRHTIEITPGPELTTLEVTRTLFNPTFDHEQIDLRIDLPCEAILDGLELRGPDDAKGREVWVPGTLIDPELATDRYFDFQYQTHGDAMDGDTIAVLSRSSNCDANLELFPVPPMRERSVRYRVQLPSTYAAGRYRVALPAFELELAGAAIHVATPPAGFGLAVDGLPVAGNVELSGRAPHELMLTPTDAEHTRVSLASIDMQALGVAKEPASVVAAEIDLPSRLVDLPPVRRVVVLVDASHSLASSSRERLQQLASAYLDELALTQPNARVEVLEFDRHVRAIHGEFVDPELASGQLHDATIESHNGSEPGLALTHARELLAAARQPGETGVDWLLLLSDLELRDEYSLAAVLDEAEASDVRMHVIRPEHGDLSLTPMPADDPWMAIAQAAGGAHFGYSVDESSLARDGAELLEPNRVWDLRLIHTDDRRRTSMISLATELNAGESAQWLDRLGTSGLDRVSFEAYSWASPLTWSAKSSMRAQQRWAGLLTSGESLGLDFEDAESKALAELAGVVTPWTSMIAEARFDGPSPEGPRSGCGGSWMGSSHGCSISCGSRSAHFPGQGFDLSVLRAAIEQAIGECQDLAPGSVSFEILDREIVVVQSETACVREAIWQLDLRSWPSFGHPIAQFAFDELGVQQLQLTSLDADAPISYAE